MKKKRNVRCNKVKYLWRVTWANVVELGLTPRQSGSTACALKLHDIWPLPVLSAYSARTVLRDFHALYLLNSKEKR